MFINILFLNRKLFGRFIALLNTIKNYILKIIDKHRQTHKQHIKMVKYRLFHYVTAQFIGRRTLEIVLSLSSLTSRRTRPSIARFLKPCVKRALNSDYSTMYVRYVYVQ